MTWTEAQLRRHKKAAAGIAIGTSTLGVSALGVAGARAGAPRAVKLAQKAGYLKRVSNKDVKRFRAKSSGIQTTLTTGAAGLGGVGGFNFAGIQSAEAKRKVRKSMSTEDSLELVWKAQSKRTRDINRGSDVGAGAGLAAGAGGVVGTRVGRFARAGYSVGRGTGSGKLKSVGTGLRTGASAARHLPKSPGTIAGAAVAGSLGAVGGSLIGGGVGAIKHDFPSLMSSKKVRKAYDPERKRLRRLEGYERTANTLSGAAGASAVAAGLHTSKKKGAFSAVKGSTGKLTKVSVSRSGLKGAAVTAGLGLASVGAAVGADRINRYKRGNGRSYRPLIGQF